MLVEGISLPLLVLLVYIGLLHGLVDTAHLLAQPTLAFLQTNKGTNKQKMDFIVGPKKQQQNILLPLACPTDPLSLQMQPHPSVKIHYCLNK